MGKKPASYPNHVRDLREKRSLMQVELAKKAGLTRQHLCAIEKGRWVPALPTQRKIAKALGLKDVRRIFPAK